MADGEQDMNASAPSQEHVSKFELDEKEAILLAWVDPEVDVMYKNLMSRANVGEYLALYTELRAREDVPLDVHNKLVEMVVAFNNAVQYLDSQRTFIQNHFVEAQRACTRLTAQVATLLQRKETEAETLESIAVRDIGQMISDAIYVKSDTFRRDRLERALGLLHAIEKNHKKELDAISVRFNEARALPHSWPAFRRTVHKVLEKLAKKEMKLRTELDTARKEVKRLGVVVDEVIERCVKPKEELKMEDIAAHFEREKNAEENVRRLRISVDELAHRLVLANEQKKEIVEKYNGLSAFSDECLQGEANAKKEVKRLEGEAADLSHRLAEAMVHKEKADEYATMVHDALLQLKSVSDERDILSRQLQESKEQEKRLEEELAVLRSAPTTTTPLSPPPSPLESQELLQSYAELATMKKKMEELEAEVLEAKKAHATQEARVKDLHEFAQNSTAHHNHLVDALSVPHPGAYDESITSIKLRMVTLVAERDILREKLDACKNAIMSFIQ